MKAKTLIENEEAERLARLEREHAIKHKLVYDDSIPVDEETLAATREFLHGLVERLKETYGVRAKLEGLRPMGRRGQGPIHAYIKVNSDHVAAITIGDLAFGMSAMSVPEISRLREFKASCHNYTSGHDHEFKNVSDALLAVEQICETFCAKLGRTRKYDKGAMFVVLFDGSGDGTCSTFRGQWDTPGGSSVKDEGILDYLTDEHGFYGAMGYLQDMTSVAVQLGGTDAQVEKYGEWEVTPEILKQLAIDHQGDGEDDDVQGSQAQALLAHLDEVARLLNSGGGEVGGDEEEL